MKDVHYLDMLPTALTFVETMSEGVVVGQSGGEEVCLTTGLSLNETRQLSSGDVVHTVVLQKSEM